MKTIETNAIITDDRLLIVKVPHDINPGNHRIVVVIDEEVLDIRKQEPLRFSAYPVDVTSESHTFRREDLYTDDGR
jgi:hypothetical protein